MAKSAEKRGKDETAAAEKKVKSTGKPAGGARGGITAPVTPSDDLESGDIARGVHKTRYDMYSAFCRLPKA